MMRRVLLPLGLTLGLATAAYAGPPCQDAPATPCAMSGPQGPAPNGPHEGPHDGPPGGPHEMLQGLNLTSAQKDQLHAAFEASRPQMQALADQSRKTRDALETTPPTDPHYPALVQAAKADAASRIDAMSTMRTQVYNILTPAQRTQLQAKILAHHAQMEKDGKEGHGRRPPPGGPGGPGGPGPGAE